MHRHAGSWTIALWVAAALIFAGNAEAKVFTKEYYKYFEVKGSTAAELGKSVRRGRNFDAVTRWEARTDYFFEGSGKACKLATIRVKLTLTVELPKLAANAVLSPPLRKKWDSFAAKVRAHENEHVRLYKLTAAELDRNLRSLSAPCGSIQDRATKIDREGFARIQKVNDDYDRRAAVVKID